MNNSTIISMTSQPSSVRFSDINSLGKVYKPKEFLEDEQFTRDYIVKRLDAGPRLINRDTLKQQKSHKNAYRPVFINFLKCEDINLGTKSRSNKTACLMMSGTNYRGDRIAAIQTNIRPFCIVSIPEGYREDIKLFIENIKGRLAYYANGATFEVKRLYDYHKFQLDKKPCIKISFTTVMNRRMALKELGKDGYITGEDDFDYTNMYLRHHVDIPLDRWLALPADTPKFEPKVPFFRDDIYSDVYQLEADHKYRPLEAYEYGHKDNMFAAAWDIETKKIGDDMTIPSPGHDYYISAISHAVGPWHTADPCVAVVFTIVGVTPESLCVPDKVPPIVVICPNERIMLQTYYEYVSRIRPEYEQAFNGGRFDYPIMRDRSDHWSKVYIDEKEEGSIIDMDSPKTVRDHFLNAYCHTIEPLYREEYKLGSPSQRHYDHEKTNYQYGDCEKSYKVKIEAGRESTLKMPCLFGTAFVDSMVLLVKAYPKIEQKNLESFLQRAKLGGKEDTTYVEMHKLLGQTEVFDSDGMFIHKNKPDTKDPLFDAKFCKFLYYSYIDSLKLHWLFHKESFILSNRALGALGRFAVMDTFFKAAGSVLMNMIASAAHNACRLMSSKYVEKEDDGTEEAFSGAYVVNPVYGLHVDRPITGVDFSSLYPSLMAAFNLSPDMVVEEWEVQPLRDAGYTILSLEIPYKIVKAGKKKDKNAVLSHKVCKAHFLQHNGIVDPEKDKMTVTRYVKNMKWTYNGSVVLRYDGVAMKDTCSILKNSKQILIDCGYNPDQCIYTKEVVKILGRPALPNECMGVNALLGQMLFDLRNEIKKPFGAAKSLKESMAANGLTEAPWDIKEGRSFPGASMHTYEQICEIYETYNARQLAIKIMANTIYGKSGQAGISIYALEVAAGITFTGQNRATKPMIDLVKSLGCEVMYGDTDSLYIKCPWIIYEELLKEYREARFQKFGIDHDESVYMHKEQLSPEQTAFKVNYLWEPMVHITRKYIDFVTEVIADTLCESNGTRYLSMAYEEVAFPTYLSGKKKYALIAHEKEINFYPTEVFLRGFDFKKRGQTIIARSIGNEFLMKILNPSFHGDSITLMKNVLIEYARALSYKDFIVYKTYNIDKNQIEIHNIVNYMTARHNHYKNIGDFVMSELYTPPMNGESFPIVYVNRIRNYDLNGKLDLKLSSADLAEPLRVIEANKDAFTVNLGKYLDKMKGFLGRLIISAGIFDAVSPDHEDDETEDEYFAKLDKVRSKSSQKYVMNMFKIIQSDGTDITTSARLAKKVANLAKKSEICDILSDLLINIKTDDYSRIQFDSFMNSFGAWIKEVLVVKEAVNYGKPRTVKELDETYMSRRKMIIGITNELIEQVITYVRGRTISDDLLSEIARGALSIHLGAVHMKHQYRDIMYMLTMIMDMVRSLEFIGLEREFVKELIKKPLVTKKDIKDAAVEWASSGVNASRFLY